MPKLFDQLSGELESHIDSIIGVCDREGLVVTLTVEIQTKRGERELRWDAHGEHEIEEAGQ